MALTYTPAGLQTQSDAVASAIDDGDFALAKAELAKAYLILMNLPAEVAESGEVVKMRSDLDKISAQVSGAAAAATSTTGDRRRLIRTRMRHES